MQEAVEDGGGDGGVAVEGCAFSPVFSCAFVALVEEFRTICARLPHIILDITVKLSNSTAGPTFRESLVMLQHFQNWPRLDSRQS